MNHLFNNFKTVSGKHKRVFVYLTMLVSILLTTACSEQPSDTYHEYQSRLANALSSPVPTNAQLTNIKLTPQLLLSQTQLNVSILQLAQLSSCALSTLIAQHNSQLGKVATPATKLIYQIEFIKTAPTCLRTLDKTSNSYQQIQAALHYKQAQLPAYFMQFLYAEAELKQSWQLTHYELDTNLNGLVETELALQQLANIKNQITAEQYQQINTHHIYKSLEQLNRFNFNQALITAVRKQTLLNNVTTNYLADIDLTSLCNPIKNKKQAHIVSNVFKKYYLAQLQPYQAQLTGALERLMPYYRAIWLQNDHVDNALAPMLQPSQSNNLLNGLKQSAKEHVIWWQRFYKTCEISPI
ncbi:hypothetical protein B5G52_07030 [Pseudoalteromonas sp. A601]|uniref:DUF3080 family protein n=1 Tax=Pseudoalteromonas sp. A601 TaxID=1967839 RepID=UPI000B3C4DF2|nr:DUF3080 family protein [Pseudoalteromonas sp. A601]OUS72921.1 hypothetical protein B5G52_07030 [Pseudoalteromonas sp. A601]